MGAIKLGGEIKTAIVDLLRYHWALLLFLFAALCATVFSVDCRQSMHVQLSLLPGLIAYVVITTFADTKDRLRIASFALSIMVFLTVLYIAPQVIATRMDNPVATGLSIRVAITCGAIYNTVKKTIIDNANDAMRKRSFVSAKVVITT